MFGVQTCKAIPSVRVQSGHLLSEENGVYQTATIPSSLSLQSAPHYVRFAGVKTVRTTVPDFLGQDLHRSSLSKRKEHLPPRLVVGMHLKTPVQRQ